VSVFSALVLQERSPSSYPTKLVIPAEVGTWETHHNVKPVIMNFNGFICIEIIVTEYKKRVKETPACR